MQTGAITDYIDVAQLVLYGFWIFFAGLVIYLRREDKREGYPLVSYRNSDRVKVQGFPAVPAPKTFKLPHGGEVQAPSGHVDELASNARPVDSSPGAASLPLGDPMRDAVGPAAYAKRSTLPDLTLDGANRIVPMRVATEFTVAKADPDPRGWRVLGLDGERGGTVHDIWVDRTEPQIRYYEVETRGARRALVPVALVKVDKTTRQLVVASITAAQFEHVPALSQPDQVSLREEDQISAYYCGGTLFATPERSEPIV
jgi:photosynthetic reaction center H subunit